MIFRNINNLINILIVMAGCSLFLSSCDDTKTYSELLRDEEKATNWYMANQKIELNVPEDSVLLYGEDAPYYKMDDDGYLYMKVLNPGNPEKKPRYGELVYFRFVRQNINSLYKGLPANWEGNSNDMNSPLGSTSLIFGNKRLEMTAQYGTAIQEPLKFLGYDSEVMMVVRSYQGFLSDQSQCIPYVYNVKYYKAEY